MKDKLGREYKVGDFVVYPSSEYTENEIGIVIKICPKTIKYKYKNKINNRIYESIMMNFKEGVIINHIIPKEMKEKLFNER